MSIVQLSGGRGWLAAPAAASIARLDKVHGKSWQITEAGRSREQADANYAAYLAYLKGGPWAPIALPGDKSVHCQGYAIDTDQRETNVLNDHGWYHTVYRNGVLVEEWHYKYFANRDNHVNESIVTTRGKDYGMEYYILREDGAVFHITPVQAYRFKSVNDYNSWRDIVKAGGVKTSLLVPPAITSLKKWPAWRVQAIADRMGVTLP